jgi:hypothetical protein
MGDTNTKKLMQERAFSCPRWVVPRRLVVVVSFDQQQEAQERI